MWWLGPEIDVFVEYTSCVRDSPCMQITELEEDIADMRVIFHEQLEEAVAQLQSFKEQSHAAMNTPTPSQPLLHSEGHKNSHTEPSGAFNA
jgi:hypothetical protein